MQRGIRSSSGCAGLVVVNDFDLVGIAIPPHKANPVLAVDAQAPLPSRSPFRRSSRLAGGANNSSTVETL